MKKTVIFITAALVLSGFLALVSCKVNTAGFDKYDPQTWSSGTESKTISHEKTKKIKEGMTLTEVVETLGLPVKDVGSGVIIMEWNTENGDTFGVSFGLAGDGNSNSADSWIVTKTHIYTQE